MKRFCLRGAIIGGVLYFMATTAVAAETTCARSDALETWLAARQAPWDQRLAPISGYEHPGRLLVCRVAGGGPRSAGQRIYLPPARGDEDLLNVAHEYVHLAFRHHPASRDEGFVEQTARALLTGEELP